MSAFLHQSYNFTVNWEAINSIQFNTKGKRFFYLSQQVKFLNDQKQSNEEIAKETPDLFSTTEEMKISNIIYF